MQTTLTPTQPEVKLINIFKTPYNNAVATARTCYSSKVIYSEDVDKDERSRDLRDRIATSIYQAGHHTTIQHATFQFVLEKVSRQFIWAFLHSHMFYNSEQVSQRYVSVKPGTFWVPPLEGEALDVYESIANFQMDTYHKLNEVLMTPTLKSYSKVFPNRNTEEKRWQSSLKKKTQEVARYILPVATHAHLYHTISGLTLHRYNKLVNSYDTPHEQKLVVGKMIAAVTEQDPLFFQNIEDSIPIEETPEYQLFHQFHNQSNKGLSRQFVEEFDKNLGNSTSFLIDYKTNAEETMGEAVRTVLGIPKEKLSNEDAIEAAMSPAKNTYYKEALNLTSHAKLTRTMLHPHFTFRKKISHTADSQDQRHRMTPGSRPIFITQFVRDKVDFITPPLISESAEATEIYEKAHQKIWEGINKLLDLGVSEEFATYLVPNSFPIRFVESGDLLNFHHKWVHRLCYTAQEEIWHNCLDEVKQVEKVQPNLVKHIYPPCHMRFNAKVTPFCPEGDRFCGKPVWKLKKDEYERVI